MPRLLRMYGKKRGHRRTGSEAWGNVGEALFYSFFLAIGTLFLTLLLTDLVVPEWRANHSFVEGRGTVIQTREGSRPADDGPVYRPEVRIRYLVDGQVFESWTFDIHYASGREFTNDLEAVRAVLVPFAIDQETTIWYDPNAPEDVVVARGYSWWLWLLLLLPLAFILIGGIGLALTLVHWGKSLEHRVATTFLSNRLSARGSAAPQIGYPTVPHDSNLTNSPGTRLKYRLPIDLTRGWRLLAIVLACLSWNGIVTVFAVAAISRHIEGRPEWLLTSFVLPFAAAGVGLIYYLVREMLIATGLGPTHIEVSDHPLRPGGKYQILVSQSGRLTLNWLEVFLACDESSTYHQGTDTRTDARRVYTQLLMRREKIEIIPGMTFEQNAPLEVPANAMHSFRADHNEVQWKLVVRVDLAGWPAFERSFPVIVTPNLQPAVTREDTAHQHQHR